MTNEIEKNILPEHIINNFILRHVDYPCVIKTKNIILEGITKLCEKNKVVWYDAVYDGFKMEYIEGLIQYGKNKIMIYFIKLEKENVFKLKILNTTESLDIVYLLLKGINKYNTID
jgi:hypothetical protein